MWLLLLGFHLVGFVGCNLLLRKSVLEKIDRLTLATFLQTGIAVPMIFVLLLYPPELRIFTSTDVFLLIAAVLLTISLQATNVKSLQYLEAGVFSILYNLRIILTTVLGILLLSEDVVWGRIAGGLLIFVAIFIVKQKGGQNLQLKGIKWGIAAALSLSFLNVTEKLLINSGGFFYYFPLASVAAAILMWGYLIAKRPNVQYKTLWKPRMLQLMTFRAMSAYGFSGALAAGALVSVANYISGMSVIVMVVLGALLLNERDYLRRKIIATAVAVCGLTIVLISSLA